MCDVELRKIWKADLCRCPDPGCLPRHSGTTSTIVIQSRRPSKTSVLDFLKTNLCQSMNKYKTNHFFWILSSLVPDERYRYSEICLLFQVLILITLRNFYLSEGQIRSFSTLVTISLLLKLMFTVTFIAPHFVFPPLSIHF